MVYYEGQTTDEWTQISLGSNCNITFNNLDLANSFVVSSTGNFTDIARVLPNQAITFDQNRFTLTKLYIKSYVAGSPCNVQIWAW